VIHWRSRLANADDASVTVELTMTVNQWRSFLLKVNENDWPAWIVGKAIHEAIGAALAHFTGEQKGEN
jgi:hypothetical protein